MFFRTLTLSLFAILLASCAQEKPYDESDTKINLIQNGQLYAKSEGVSSKSVPFINFCTLEDPCLWTPSVAEVPKDVAASRPYSMGTAKLVVTRLTETQLQILQIEEDERFNDNINNFSPVAHFDIEHIDFKCKKDNLNKCTNVEEEDKEKFWTDKRYIKIKKVVIDEVNSLPIQLDNALSSSACYTAGEGSPVEIGEKMLDVESNEAINFSMKVPFSAKASCSRLRELNDLRYMNFFVDYDYSLIKISKFADPNYVPLTYPKSDERFFGLFKTTKREISPDNRDDVFGTKSFLGNRWSPDKEEIVYYLNETFYKPEMAAVLKSTQDAIITVNDSLARAGAKFEIVLKNGAGKRVGDLRNNFLVLVDDPQASGVIGYGPSIANPLTGEILHARTVMFYGTIVKFLTRAYDERVDALNKAQADAQAAAAAAAATNSANNANSSAAGESNSRILTENIALNLNLPQLKNVANIGLNNAVKNMRGFELENVISQINEMRDDEFALRFDNQEVDLDAANVKATLKNINDNILDLSKRNYYHASMFNFEGAVDASMECVETEVTADGVRYLKWEELAGNKELQKKALDCLMPNVWVPTLVHEFGHNLGLRHNFFGSRDKENWFTEGEMADRLPTHSGDAHMHEHKKKITYSSIMDYAYSTINELSIFGKYDEAVFSYAYAGKVQLESKDFASINGNITEFPEREAANFLKSRGIEIKDLKNIEAELNRLGLSASTRVREAAAGAKVAMEKAKSIKAEIKRYEYCSDENVGTDETCNRFDEGSNAKEITEHYVRAYKKSYDRNFRGLRTNFSGRYGDWSYFISKINSLFSIRVFFDRFDQANFRGDYEDEIMTKPEEELTESEKAQKARLVSLKEASDVAFNALMEIVETPAYHCVEYNTESGRIQRIEPFNVMAEGTQLQEYGITFDIRYGCQFLTSFARSDDNPENDKLVYFSMGKYFNNSLDLTIAGANRDQIVEGDTSQMDVRGYWMDKLAASILLTLRSQSPTNIGAASNGSFLDYPEYKEKFLNFMSGLLTNKFTKPVEIKSGDTTVATIPVTYGFEGNHKINKSYNPIVKIVFNLDTTQKDARMVMLDTLKDMFSVSYNSSNLSRDTQTYDDFNTRALNLRSNVADFNFDKVVEFINPRTGELSFRFGVHNYNTFAFELAKKKEVLDQLEKLSQPEIMLVVQVVQVVRAATSDEEIQEALAGIQDEELRKLVADNIDNIFDAMTGALTQQSLVDGFKALNEKGRGLIKQIFL